MPCHGKRNSGPIITESCCELVHVILPWLRYSHTRTSVCVCVCVFLQTFSQREKRQQLQKKRKALLDARMTKVRQRKLKKQGIGSGEVGGGTDGASSQNLTDFNFDTIENKPERNEGTVGGGVSEISALLAAEYTRSKEQARIDQEARDDQRRAAYVRPWDRGKGDFTGWTVMVWMT